MDLRIVLGCALLAAVVAGGVALASGQDYRARAFVIRVPPEAGSADGLARARSDRVLRTALALAGERDPDAAWLRERSRVELTSRRDLAITVETEGREQAARLATAYAEAIRGTIPHTPGLATRGQGARDSQPTLGPAGWALLGAAGGLWLGMALAIVLAARSRRSLFPP